jgi:group I intron endonuclease
MKWYWAIIKPPNTIKHNMKNRICGIYCIENLINGKKYIGASKNIEKRIYSHFQLLRNGKHYGIIFQKEFDMFGEKSFNYYILEECEKDRKILNKLEIFYIRNLQTLVMENGYNISKGGNNTFEGKTLSKEAREKQRQKKLGKIVSDDTKLKLKLLASQKDISGENNPAYGEHFSQGKKVRKNTTSKYVGVCLKDGLWCAKIQFNKKRYELGYYKSEVNAALAYNKKAIELYGKDAKLNII